MNNANNRHAPREPGSPPAADEGVIRCICGYDEDDGFTIQASLCSSLLSLKAQELTLFLYIYIVREMPGLAARRLRAHPEEQRAGRVLLRAVQSARRGRRLRQGGAAEAPVAEAEQPEAHGGGWWWQ